MKRNTILLLIPFAILVSLAFAPRHAVRVEKAAAEKEYARCTGSTPCTACSNCSACKYCSGGGTCGVCAKSLKAGSAVQQKRNSSSTVNTTRCRATTKKRSRCSRNARSGEYCWQHGG